MKQITTLAIIEDGSRVLLAMKKKGFGAGWWNGYGGKVEEGEDVDDAMIRELREESGLLAKEHTKRGVINFIFDGKDLEVEMHIYSVSAYEGELIESEEMAPKWFPKEEIPFDQMWPADRDWLPLFFEGKEFTGRVVFDGETRAVIRSEFQTAESEVIENRKPNLPIR